MKTVSSSEVVLDEEALSSRFVRGDGRGYFYVYLPYFAYPSIRGQIKRRMMGMFNLFDSAFSFRSVSFSQKVSSMDTPYSRMLDRIFIGTSRPVVFEMVHTGLSEEEFVQLHDFYADYLLEFWIDESQLTRSDVRLSA